MFDAFKLPVSWWELIKRTAKDSIDDGITGLAAQLAYYFFLALFPALLFLVALASFFPLQQAIDQITGALVRFAPGDVVKIVQEQLAAISDSRNGGLLTIDEVLERYNLTLEEFAGWQRAVDRSGMQGLRVTRIQHYRDLYERQLKY